MQAAAEPSGDPSARPETRATSVVHSIRTDHRVAFLTIDDGATRTPDMLRVLRDNGIKATFFLTDQFVRQDADFFRRGRDGTGATIQNHTLSHPNLKGKPEEFQRTEICGTSDNLERTFGERPTLLRPPYGNYDKATLRVAQSCGMQHVVHWSAEIQKGEMTFAAGSKLTPGDIVLMHFTEHFREDVTEFVDQVRKAGLKPALLEDYLK